MTLQLDAMTDMRTKLLAVESGDAVNGLVLVVPGLPTAIVLPTGTAVVGVRTKKSVESADAACARSVRAAAGMPCTRQPTMVTVCAVCAGDFAAGLFCAAIEVAMGNHSSATCEIRSIGLLIINPSSSHQKGDLEDRCKAGSRLQGSQRLASSWIVSDVRAWVALLAA